MEAALVLGAGEVREPGRGVALLGSAADVEVVAFRLHFDNGVSKLLLILLLLVLRILLIWR